jgi:hypothetical protein
VPRLQFFFVYWEGSVVNLERTPAIWEQTPDWPDPNLLKHKNMEAQPWALEMPKTLLHAYKWMCTCNLFVEQNILYCFAGTKKHCRIQVKEHVPLDTKVMPPRWITKSSQDKVNFNWKLLLWGHQMIVDFFSLGTRLNTYSKNKSTTCFTTILFVQPYSLSPSKQIKLDQVSI